MNIERVILPVLMSVFFGGAAFADAGKDLYTKTCAVCHAAGIAGAPRFGSGRLAALSGRRNRSLVCQRPEGYGKGMPAGRQPDRIGWRRQGSRGFHAGVGKDRAASLAAGCCTCRCSRCCPGSGCPRSLRPAAMAAAPVAAAVAPVAK